MSRHSEPTGSDCDAPAYTVVKACGGLGFRSPLDVRWCRLSSFMAGRRQNAGLLARFFRMQPRGRACLCGQLLPALERYTFTFRSETRRDYFLGQCPHCQTIYWEDAPELRRREGQGTITP